jgi:hypothetical protein
VFEAENDDQSPRHGNAESSECPVVINTHHRQHRYLRTLIMKLLVCAVTAIASLSFIPSFAQAANSPLTRAQVEEQLVQLEQAGYRPSTHDADYPNEIQAAEAKVQAMNTSYGGSGNDASTGAPTGASSVQAPAAAQ